MDHKLDIRNGLQSQSQELLTMEEALKKLGGFSRFQLCVTISLLLIDFPAVMLSMNPLLTGTAHVLFRCKFENGTSVNISESMLCSYNCTGSILPIGKPPYTSIVQEWVLICGNSWVSDTAISIQMVGNLVGSLVVAYCSDRFGRKRAFYTNAFLMGITGILCAVSTGPIFFAAARFLTGFAIGGSFTSHFNYLMEFLPAKWRQICGCVSFWSLGEMALGLVGYLIPGWRTVSWATASPAFVIFLTIFFIPESPRWALANGKTSDASAVLNSISRWNGKPQLSPEEVESLQATVVLEKVAEDKETNNSWRAFRDTKLLKVLLAFSLAWFANAVVYFGITFNMKNISGDPYWNIFFLGVVDLPAELSGFYFSNKFGRRKTFIAYLLIASVFLVILLIVEVTSTVNSFPWMILVFSLLGKFFNEGSWAVMACFTSESFPTVCRSFTLSICCVASTIGGVIAPQLTGPAIPKMVPYLVFAVLSILSSIVSLTLPEMKGKPLVDG